MTAEWFDDYLTPLFKVNGARYFDAEENITAEDIGVLGINLTVCIRGQGQLLEKIGDEYLITESDIVSNIEKYYGKNVTYEIDDDQFRYDETKKRYLSTLEFGVGCVSEGPEAEYVISNVISQGNDVTLNVLEDYKGEADNRNYTLSLECYNDNCIIKSIEEK